jgi:hypothetical protein
MAEAGLKFIYFSVNEESGLNVLFHYAFHFETRYQHFPTSRSSAVRKLGRLAAGV